MLDKSRLMPISYYNPKQEIRLSAYADTIVLEPDGREQHLRAIRFGGYPEMVRAMSDAIYAGATLETEFAGETAMLSCEPKKYECHLSHDGIYEALKGIQSVAMRCASLKLAPTLLRTQSM